MDAHKRRSPVDAVNAEGAEDVSHDHFTTTVAEVQHGR